MGDEFLKEILGELTKRKNAAKLKDFGQPYIYQQFNVSAHYSNTGIRNGINKIFTPFVTALNEKKRLPNYILVIPDADILQFIQYMNGTSMLIGAVMHHIIRQIDVMIQRRCSDLFEIKQGALVDEEFPKIIWVRMLKRPKELAKGVLALRGKFNSILEERLLDGNKENHYIMSIDVSEMEFNATGNLSLEGKKTF